MSKRFAAAKRTQWTLSKKFRPIVLRREIAVTLMELVMVMMVVGILAAISIPRFSSFYLLKLNGAVKKAAADIRYVQNIAVSRHANTKIVFNATGDTYTAQEESPPGSGIWVNITSPFSRSNLTLNFTSDLQYGGIDIFSTNLSSSTLRFTWEGVPQEGTDGAPGNLAAERSIIFRYKGNNLGIYITVGTGMLTVR